MEESANKNQTSENILLPKGIHRIWTLPDNDLSDIWKSIIMPSSIKDKLLSQAVLNFTIRNKVSRTVLPLHGVILLYGPPGTGKTSLARGLSNRVAETFGKKSGLRLLEVEPHSLTSSAMGKTQRAVSDLFSQAISESALAGPTIVLLDEVETLAVDRSKLSLEANPIDIHRATDAVLVQLDMLAEKHPNLLFIATSNFPEAVDSAFTSRCDLIMEIPLPDKDACEKILIDCLNGLGATYSKIKDLTNEPDFTKLVKACVGLDGRAIRKMISNGLAATPQTAMNPETVSIENLIDAATTAKSGRNKIKN